MPSTTCGTLFRTFFDHLFPADTNGWHPLIAKAPNPLHAIGYVGFTAGQAEKVASGACRAFMIRPAPAWREWAREQMAFACDHYGLEVMPYEHEGVLELWACQREWLPMLWTALTQPHNSPTFHYQRARLCGIPVQDIDPEYHLREGHGTQCEVEMTPQQAAGALVTQAQQLGMGY